MPGRSTGPALPAARYSLPTTSSAFTLVELLIGAALSAAILAAVLSSYLFLGRQLTRLANQQTLETEARRTLGFFTQDVHRATGVTVSTATAPAFYITFTVPRTTAGVTQVTYYFSRAAATPSISGTTVTVPANSLVRVESTGSAIVGSAQVILRNVISTDEGCAMRFFDASGNPYDNGSAPFTPVTTYWPGVRFASLQFITQTGTAAAGVQTPQLRMTSGRLALRNRNFLQ